MKFINIYEMQRAQIYFDWMSDSRVHPIIMSLVASVFISLWLRWNPFHLNFFIQIDRWEIMEIQHYKFNKNENKKKTIGNSVCVDIE